MSKLRLSFHVIKGSGHLGQAELYPDYWNFKIILGKGQHIVNKVLKSRIRMYGSLYLIKSRCTTKLNFRTERPFEPKMLPRPVSFLFYGIWKIWHQWSRRSWAPGRMDFFIDVRRHKISPLSSPYEYVTAVVSWNKGLRPPWTSRTVSWLLEYQDNKR